MNLKEFIKMNEEDVNEMAYGDDEASAVKAVEVINKEAPLVLAAKDTKNVGAMYGTLEAALKALGKTTAPEKYTREIGLAKKALSKLQAYNKTVSVRDTPSMAACANLDKKTKK